jgi:hypothetical protein
VVTRTNGLSLPVARWIVQPPSVPVGRLWRRPCPARREIRVGGPIPADGPRRNGTTSVKVLALARRWRPADYSRLRQRKRDPRAANERHRPLEVDRAEELALMNRDIFDDRRSFTPARYAFVNKQTTR